MLALINTIKKDGVISNKYKSIRKTGNKIVKILTKSKSQNLSKFRFKILFRLKKIQNTSTMEDSNSLTPNTKVVFTKLKQAFIQILIF